MKRIQVRGVLWTLVVGLLAGCSAAGGPGPDYFVVPDRLTDGLGDISSDAGTEPTEREAFDDVVEHEDFAIDAVDSETERAAFDEALEHEDLAIDD